MSYRFARPLLTMLLVLAVAGTSFAEEKAKLKGLLITGGCCHDYPAQIKIITEGLSQRVNIEWDVVIAGDGRQVKVPVYLNHDWIKPYDVVFHNECYGHVDDVEFVEGIVKAHTENNIPAIFVHCSMHSYRNAKTDEWRKLIGMRSTSHEGKHPLDIVTLESDHPIMQGFPKDWKVDRGELYKIEKTWDSATPLAKAYGVDTKKDHNVIWCNEYDGTKSFSTTLGHYNETMNNDVWLSLVARGLLWTVDGLNEDGTTKPGFEGTGKKEIDLSTPNPDKDKSPTKAKK
ncbi:ThuA domain-containing protein [Bremerella sp. T1]|uniref:ThuA domain-containing protein n=1 Tax=Bremerella sp. TYQ1 TaxID=3119568 RepID=UPI001CCD244B|nr:ThuA domain-containing protein [Bremerella volcania]UBM34223.1 ThuA domain-containing protein [Bremerella volcania]